MRRKRKAEDGMVVSSGTARQPRKAKQKKSMEAKVMSPMRETLGLQDQGRIADDGLDSGLEERMVARKSDPKRASLRRPRAKAIVVLQLQTQHN